MKTDFNLLTSKQKKVYSAIESFIKQRGIPPTVREIGEMIGERTPGAVQGILNRLEQKGVIKREVGMARSIQIVSDDSLYAEVTYIPEIRKVSSRNADDLLNVYNIEKYNPISRLILGETEACFVIECSDDSMMKTIRTGDKLFISTVSEIYDGDVIMIIYDNHTLLRRYQQHDNPEFIRLTADSDLFDKEVFRKDEVRIIGKVVGTFKTY